MHLISVGPHARPILTLQLSGARWEANRPFTAPTKVWDTCVGKLHDQLYAGASLADAVLVHLRLLLLVWKDLP